jgi:hypothetical protein
MFIARMDIDTGEIYLTADLSKTLCDTCPDKNCQECEITPCG